MLLTRTPYLSPNSQEFRRGPSACLRFREAPDRGGGVLLLIWNIAPEELEGLEELEALEVPEVPEVLT